MAHLNLLEKDFKGISLYFEDIKDFFTKEEIKKNILYVDMDNYPSSMVSPLIIFLLEFFKNIPVKEKILVFDECWSFLKNHASYIEECFRTFRKTGAFPIAISQSLQDFNGELFSSISNNTFFKIFFPQEMEEISSFDREKIENLGFIKGEYSDCYLLSSDNRFRKTIRYYPTKLEWELFQTDPTARDDMLDFLERFGRYFESNRDAIDSFIKLKSGGHLDDYLDLDDESDGKLSLSS